VENGETLKVWLEALIDTNRVFLRNHPDTPKLYDSGVFYARTEDWDPIPVLYSEGYHGTDLPWCRVKRMYGKFGDCKSLACARIAELREAGKVAKVNHRFAEKPIIAPQGSWQDGNNVFTDDGRPVSQNAILLPDRTITDLQGNPKTRFVYHILVQTGLNDFEDPSKLCGMTDNELAYL
jgi:hypothetical protein